MIVLIKVRLQYILSQWLICHPMVILVSTRPCRLYQTYMVMILWWHLTSHCIGKWCKSQYTNNKKVLSRKWSLYLIHFISHVPRASCLTCSHALRASCHTCSRNLHASCLTCSRVSHVFHALVPHVLCALRVLWVLVPRALQALAFLLHHLLQMFQA